MRKIKSGFMYRSYGISLFIAADRQKRWDAMDKKQADICPSRDDAQPHIFEHGKCCLCGTKAS